MSVSAVHSEDPDTNELPAHPFVAKGSPALTRSQRRAHTAQALAARAVTSHEGRRQELLEYVVSINMDVARSVASRFFNRGIEEDDLVQVAYAALTRAAADFDPAMERDFLSYAVPTIRGELKKHFRDVGWTVRPTRRIQEMQARVGSVQEVLAQQLQRAPRPSEIAEHLGADLEDVIEAMAADGCFVPASLDRPVGSGIDGFTIGDMIGGDDPAHGVAEARVTLAPVVRRLKERDRRIVYLRFFEERTQEQIGAELGITQMQVSRLLARIMRDLRAELT